MTSVIKLNESFLKIDESSGDGSEAKLRTVFVSNLDFDVNENKIIEILGMIGKPQIVFTCPTNVT